MEKITAKNNDLIKSVKKLLSSSKKRKEENCFVLEGARLVFDALNSLYKVKYFLVTQAAYDKYQQSCDEMLARAERSYIITDDIADRLSETKSSQGVFAVCEMKDDSFIPTCDSRLIALDNVQDPGNLGTILRTAEALGIDGVIIGGGCDLYNPKVLRSAMGSALRQNVVQCDNLEELLNSLKAKGFSLYGTVPDSSARSVTDVDFTGSSVCVIGNEANGISSEIKSLCDSLVTIKMKGSAESLNASVASAITMWEMLR